MDRTILHCDMDGFYASVELLRHPELRERPMAVCGNPENRHGIILAKNELAKRQGVVTAETIWQAKKKCPDLACVPPHHETYRRYSVRINEIYQRFTDMVEPFSIDESWLDVTASRRLFGDGKAIADNIRDTVREELGLTVSVGVSFNKIFAKMGSDCNKPDGTTLISRETYRDILWVMPIRRMFSVGQATAEKLQKTGIQTIGDLARSNKTLLTKRLGKHGAQLHDYANGLDDSPVCLYREREQIKSVGNGMTFRRNLQGLSDVKVAVTSLSDTVASRLRQYRLKGQGVKVDIKDPNFKVISRQRQLDTPTHLAEEIADCALGLIQAAWSLNKPIRLLTVTAINLCPAGEDVQLSLLDEGNQRREKAEKMEHAMDRIRARFGSSAISFGGILGNDLGIAQTEEDSTLDDSNLKEAFDQRHPLR